MTSPDGRGSGIESDAALTLAHDLIACVIDGTRAEYDALLSTADIPSDRRRVEVMLRIALMFSAAALAPRRKAGRAPGKRARKRAVDEMCTAREFGPGVDRQRVADVLAYAARPSRVVQQALLTDRTESILHATYLVAAYVVSTELEDWEREWSLRNPERFTALFDNWLTTYPLLPP